ncbi:hypothetical protein [Halalkalibacter nanhaiisediminis]|uniref:Uncharacterized protein n=1 Tax=Halalkalibacter nanhaiisediminis TaxID=688079 RepID=A0A562QMS0_9BACI|nr:hypothetical protein [Halalkalibacter nanhaiisediminis]TWI58052.1 hypothetical protein IQ10_01383 [Halalkalibacter nanhaiisediminis]
MTLLEQYLEEKFGIMKEDILISPTTNQKKVVQELLLEVEQDGRTENVFGKIEQLKVLGRKGVIVYLNGLSDQTYRAK